MNTLEPFDSNSIKPTHFDLIKLKDLQVGEFYDNEARNWRTLCYKHCYVLFCVNNLIDEEYQEFNNLDELIGFLNK